MLNMILTDTSGSTRELEPNDMKVEEKIDWDWQILDCIDDALGVFGENVKFAIYRNLLTISNLERGGIIQNLELFLNTLKETFGLGAWAVEGEIVRNIKSRFHLKTLDTEELTVIIGIIRAIDRSDDFKTKARFDQLQLGKETRAPDAKILR